MKAIIGRKKSDETIHNFINGQLRPNKILNQALLEAFLAVNRADFLPPAAQSFAYVDANLPAGKGRFFMSPLILAQLMNLVEIKPADRCLVIGSLTGYSAALLSVLTVNYFVVEQEPVFCELLQEKIKEPHRIHQGTLTQGWPEQAPFDWILIEGGAEMIPSLLFDQLAEGGSLVTVYKKNDLMGHGSIWQKTNGVVTFKCMLDAYVPLLSGFKEKKSFSL